MLFLIVVAATCTLAASKAVSAPQLRQVVEPKGHSECPTWDDRNNILYFVNIPGGQIYRYDYASGDLRSITLNGQVAPVIPSKNDPNLLIAGLDRSVVAVQWDGQSEPSQTKILASVSSQFPQSRVNDGKADKQGRLWLGTMSTGSDPNQGVLYEVTCRDLNSPLVEIAPVGISNGVAWNKANDKFYYIDTPTGQVVEYLYNDADGSIKSPRVAFNVYLHYDKVSGSPDGMTIDKDDNLWIALNGGGVVVQVNPQNGDILQVVTIPNVTDITSLIWGGPNLDILYITTSNYYLNDDQKRQQPTAGSVFAATGLGTQGLPVYPVDLIHSINDQAC